MLAEVRGDELEVVLPYQPQDWERWKDGVLVRAVLWHQTCYY